MSSPQTPPAPSPMRWETLGTGADLWATVVMASGFVLQDGQTVREHYRIVRTLGQGGMGQVLGVTLVGSPDAQTFAMKMVARPSGASNDPADRLAAEQQAKAFAALLRGEAAKQELVQRHGVSVARLFALVRFEDGSLGLRMEIARGQSLESFLDAESRQRAEKEPDLEYCLIVMRKVLYQLRRLHELVDPSSPVGFVHSDIKPGNIFVDDGDRYDPYVTLLDFGVATAGHALDGDGVSRAGGRKSLILHDAGGTFGFAPPHHFTGKPTPLSDVYAALVILYELIALQSPWDFGDIPKSAPNLFRLEEAMRKGPRPLRSRRTAIAPEQAARLDAFFSEEFKALQTLADEAHVARNAADPSRRQAMSEHLRTLARTYQKKVDDLRVELTGASGASTRTSDPEPKDTPFARAATEAAPSPLREAETRLDSGSKRQSESRERKPKEEPGSLAGRDEPIRVPMRPLFGWTAAMLVIVAGGIGSWVWMNGLPRPVAERITAAWGGPATPLDASAPTAMATVDSGVTAVAASAPDVVPPTVAASNAAVAPSVVVDAGPQPIAAAVAVDAGAIEDVQTLVAAVSDASVPIEPDANTIAVLETPDASIVADAAVPSDMRLALRDVPDAGLATDVTGGSRATLLAPPSLALAHGAPTASQTPVAARPPATPLRGAPAPRATAGARAASPHPAARSIPQTHAPARPSIQRPAASAVHRPANAAHRPANATHRPATRTTRPRPPARRH